MSAVLVQVPAPGRITETSGPAALSVSVAPRPLETAEVVYLGSPGPAGRDADVAPAIAAHAYDSAPHAAYDDIPSLALLFENRLL
jgi:hypothetical protein